VLRTLFVFGILTVGIPLALYSRFYALLLYLWWALFRPEFFIWWDITGLRISLILGIILLVPCLFSRVFPNVSHPLTAGSVAFLAVSFLSTFVALNQDVAWQWFDAFTRLVIVCLLTVTLVNTRERFLATLAVVAGSFGFHTAKAGLGSLLGGGVQYFEGVGGMFNDNNLWALGAAMIIPLLVAVAQNAPRKWLKLGFFLAAPLSVFTVISLFSRGGILALVAGVLVLAVLQRRRFTYLTVIAVFAGLTLMYAPIPEGWFNRVDTLRTATNEEAEGGDRSALGRLHFWQTGVAMAMDRPLGVGIKNYEIAYDRYDSTGGYYGGFRSVHSSHIQVLAEMGFLGALLWVVMFGWSFVLIFRIRRRSRDPRLSPENARFTMTMANGLAASMAGFLVGGSFASMALNDITWLTFALLASLDRVTLQMCEETVEEPVKTATVAGALPRPVPVGAAGRIAVPRPYPMPLERGRQ